MVATPRPNRLSPRQIGLILGGIVLTIVLFIVLTPGNSWQQSGSTYNKSPDGYAAWYSYAESRSLNIKQSRQSIADLLQAQQKTPNSPPQTLLQIQPRLISSSQLFRTRSVTPKTIPPKLPKPKSTPKTVVTISSEVEDWLEAGNNLVVLGVKQPVRSVPFSSRVPSPVGPVVIETSRRALGKETNPRLADDSGAIVWELQNPSAKPLPPNGGTPTGKLILASTPYLAANAYQEAPGNYAFLTDLLRQLNAPIVVDERIHGYREPVASESEKRRQSSSGKSSERSGSGRFGPGRNGDRDDRSILDYFAQTPLLPIAVQSIVLVAIAIWARNRRFGRIQTIDQPSVDNSQAYIRALAGSLRQANSRSFVMETVGQAELRQLQQQLGLGSHPMSLADIIEAWTAQQQPTDDLKTLLRLQQRPDISDRELLTWLQSWQRLRQG
ncbi:MAG: hypothetical protein RLZZ511_1853 [Cyanobacteriota bacterium]|jgi:hypothetical protein